MFCKPKPLTAEMPPGLTPPGPVATYTDISFFSLRTRHVQNPSTDKLQSSLDLAEDSFGWFCAAADTWSEAVSSGAGGTNPVLPAGPQILSPDLITLVCFSSSHKLHTPKEQFSPFIKLKEKRASVPFECDQGGSG